MKELIAVLYGSETINTMKEGYNVIVNCLREKGLDHAAVHLKRAENEIGIARENNFPYPTISPVEREMREINRRSDVGVRWSVTGVENLLLVKTYRRLNRPKRKKVTKNCCY